MAASLQGCDAGNNSGSAGDVGQKFILVIDVGTTTVRCHIYNKAARIVTEAEQKVGIKYISITESRYKYMCFILYIFIVSVP